MNSLDETEAGGELSYVLETEHSRSAMAFKDATIVIICGSFLIKIFATLLVCFSLRCGRVFKTILEGRV